VARKCSHPAGSHTPPIEQATMYAARQVLFFLRESIDQYTLSVAAETTNKKRSPYPITGFIFHHKAYVCQDG